MELAYKNCQSCGMPLKRSPNGGGTNANKTISKMYCAYCYEDGGFKQPNWTASEMQNFVKEKLKEMGFPGFLTGFFTKGVPKLQRWNRTKSKVNLKVFFMDGVTRILFLQYIYKKDLI